MLELLTVLVVLAVLVAIAVPAYLSLAQRGRDAAARTNLRHLASDMEAYQVDNGASGYVGADLASIASFDNGLKFVTVVSTSTSTYCIATVGSTPTWYRNGPSAPITRTVCT